ncbi:hypothetical protein [Pseudomonas sp. CJQ_13]|uniref:restriction endonuclease-related protein n=1 Tax=Pseudomonas sp. CJQ_13 TaxID=3367170 RepID=UPI00370BF719
MASTEGDVQRLINLIVRAANLRREEAAVRFDLLRQVSALLWWLDPETPARSVPLLDRSLSLPIQTWLKPELRQGIEGTLRVGDEPSLLCKELELETDQKAALERCQQIIKNVRDLCATRPQGIEEYRFFRLFIVEHGTVHADANMDFLIPLTVSFSSLFEDLPAHLIKAGKVYLCPCCGWPLPIHRADIWCGSLWCEHQVGLFQWHQRQLISVRTSKPVAGSSAKNLYRLNRGVWKFTLIPGLLERRLWLTLAKLGLNPELWPNVDQYDLQVTVGSQTFLLDAKSWRYPELLARHLNSSPISKAIIIIPDYQANYVTSLREQCHPRQLMTESQFIQKVKRICKP